MYPLPKWFRRLVQKKYEIIFFLSFSRLSNCPKKIASHHRSKGKKCCVYHLLKSFFWFPKCYSSQSVCLSVRMFCKCVRLYYIIPSILCLCSTLLLFLSAPSMCLCHDMHFSLESLSLMFSPQHANDLFCHVYSVGLSHSNNPGTIINNEESFPDWKKFNSQNLSEMLNR